MKTKMILAFTAVATGLFAATWPMTDTEGQEIVNTGKETGLSGYLGSASKPDSLDAKKTGADGILCDGKTTVTIPSSPFFSFINGRGFTLSIEIMPLEELDEISDRFRFQIVTKGADSEGGGWQLRYVRNGLNHPYRLEFYLRTPEKKMLTFSVPYALFAQEWTKITVTMDRKECKIYANGELLKAFPCQELPYYSKSPLKIGVYAFGDQFGFPGKYRNLVIEKKAIPPVPAK